MWSSKSKKRGSSEVEESVHMDIDVSSEDHANRPLEIENEEKATQEEPES